MVNKQHQYRNELIARGELSRIHIRMSPATITYFVELAYKYNYNRSQEIYRYANPRTLRSTNRYGMGMVLASLILQNPSVQDYVPNPTYFPSNEWQQSVRMDLSDNQIPTWYDHPDEQREHITFYLPADVPKILLAISTHFKIYDQRDNAPITNQTSRIGATLEAIGQQFLIPQYPPLVKVYSTRPRQAKTWEFNP